MRTAAAKAFDLDEEPAALRDAYGRNLFGQGCLLARRLVERGVPFVEVTLGGVNGDGRRLGHAPAELRAGQAAQRVLDPAWATLMDDLKQRGLLDSTLIVWMGEFGRTPKINRQQGRDHFPNAWTTVLAGGGIKGGQAIGKTSADGMTVEDRPVSVPDFLATVCLALGIDPTQAEHLQRRPAHPHRRPERQAASRRCSHEDVTCWSACPGPGGRRRRAGAAGRPPDALARPTTSRTSSTSARRGRCCSGCT